MEMRLFRITVLALACCLKATMAMAQTATAPPPVTFGGSQGPLDVSAAAGAVGNPMAALGPPAILWLRGQGASVQDLGSAHGLEGWLAMAKDQNGNQKFQVFYTTPDGDGLVAGVMFDTHQKDVTALQLAATQEGKSLVVGSAAPTQTTPAPAATPAGPTAQTAIATPAGQMAPQPPASGPQAEVLRQAPSALATTKSNRTGTDANPTDDLADSISDADLDNFVTPFGVSPDQFAKVLKLVAYFRVGDASLPNLYLVADPHCPICHKAWEYLRPLVQDRKIAVTVILIHGLPETESPTADAVALLANPDPAAAWLDGEGNTDGVPFPPPANEAARASGIRYLQYNDNFAQALQVAQTPTVFWYQNGQTFRGQDLGSVIAFMKAVLKGGVGS